MRITIDTREDSQEDIRKAIRMLSSLVGDTHQGTGSQKNIFDDENPSDTPVLGNIFDEPQKEDSPDDSADSDKVEIVY